MNQIPRYMKKITLVFIWLLSLLSLHGFSQNAPVTTAGTVINPPPGPTINVPITVTNFVDIGSISLVMDFDPAVVTYTGFSANASLPGLFVGESTPGRLSFTWFGFPGVTLPDLSEIVTLTFTYPVGSTFLTWHPVGDSCEYAKFDGGNYTVLNDIPKSSYYINGFLAGHSAPVTIAPFIFNPPVGTIDVPIKVIGFNDIGAISLTFEYDSTVIQYQNIYIADPMLDATGIFIVGTRLGINGKKNVYISWMKTALLPNSLPDSSTIITLKFNYLSPPGTSLLTWVDDGSSCEYADGDFNPMNDTPTGIFYKDGFVTSQGSAPITIAPIMTSYPEQPICIPVTVVGFNNIGAVSLRLDYNPAVLTFQSLNPVGIPGAWSFFGDASVPGILSVTGFGEGFSLNDYSTLFEACFTYHTGSTILSWYDDGSSCEYADGTTYEPLYDLPQSTYYINGFVGPSTVSADFVADNLTPPENTTVTFTDLSIGSPTTWSWTFAPATVNYVNGTNANSQNPQVEFLSGGLYTVTLVASNLSGSDTEIKTNYIRVGIPGLWTGNTSTDWFTETNWDNWLVPDSFIDVVIPPAALNWPVFIGNLTLGVQCRTITLTGPTSYMTITGDLITN